MYCTKCGAEIADDDKFCSRCGQPVGAQAPTGEQQPAAQTQPAASTGYAPQTGQAAPGPQDYQPYQQQPYQQQPYQAPSQAPVYVSDQPTNTRVLAMLFYWGSLISIIVGVVVADRTNPFIRHHLNQAFVLLIIWFICAILSFLVIPALIEIAVFVFMIIGSLEASRGGMKKLPLIGEFQPLK